MTNQKLNATMEEAASNMTDQARETMASVNTSLLKALDRNRTIMQGLVRAMQEESLRFVNMRLEHTSRTFERSRECQGISAIVTLQQDWLLGIARDYAELNKRFGEVLHEMTEHGANGVSEAIAEAAGTKKTPKPERPGERAAAA